MKTLMITKTYALKDMYDVYISFHDTEEEAEKYRADYWEEQHGEDPWVEPIDIVTLTTFRED